MLLLEFRSFHTAACALCLFACASRSTEAGRREPREVHDHHSAGVSKAPPPAARPDDAAQVDSAVAPWVETAKAPAVSAGAIVWQAFSEELMHAARDQGRPVFLQFSAEWCKPCEVHEREYFSKPDIRQLFADSGVLPVKADMTRPNDLMEDWLFALERFSLPTYAVYDPDGSVDVLPMRLTRDALVAALVRARER